MSIPKMTRFVLGASAAVFAFIDSAQGEEPTPAAPLPPPAAAATVQPTTKDELAQFGEFLDQNPNVEARLRENTALVGDPAFIKNHRPFAEFLAQHPQLRTELSAQPRWFLHREFIRQSTPPVTPEQIAEFDRFLDEHPELAQQLVQNPQLLSQKDFFNRTPALQDYVNLHPEIHRTVTVLRSVPVLNRTTPNLPVKPPAVPKVRIKGKL